MRQCVSTCPQELSDSSRHADQAEMGAGTILPPDVWRRVLRQLPQAERMRMRLVCKAFVECSAEDAGPVHAVLKSRAGAHSLELFLAKCINGEEPALHLDLRSKGLLFTPGWAHSSVVMATSYRHLQSIAISHRLDYQAAAQFLQAVPSTLISLDMQTHPAAAHADWYRLQHLQRLSLGLEDSAKVFSGLRLKQLLALTSLTFRGPGRELIAAAKFSLPKLQLLSMEENAFAGHLDLAGFPKLAEISMWSAAGHIGWLLHHPLPRLTFIAVGAELYPACLKDRFAELHCSVLRSNLTSFQGRAVLKVKRLAQMPHLSKIMLYSSKNVEKVQVQGSFATYSALLQHVDFQASGKIGLVLLTDELRIGDALVHTPLRSNGHSQFCQCASCTCKH